MQGINISSDQAHKLGELILYLVSKIYVGIRSLFMPLERYANLPQGVVDALVLLLISSIIAFVLIAFPATRRHVLLALGIAWVIIALAMILINI
jgi:hypothetical protein